MPAQLTKNEVVQFYIDGEWKHYPDAQIIGLQLYQEGSRADWFCKSTEIVLDNLIWSSEFSDGSWLMLEFEKRSKRDFIMSSAVMLLMIALIILVS